MFYSYLCRGTRLQTRLLRKVYSVKVKSVRRVGKKRCWDILNVSNANCFAIEQPGLVVHNSFGIDEVNFMREKKDNEKAKMVGQAYDIFNTVSTRLRSRFMRQGGSIPGIMILMSSRNSQTSFLEDKLNLAKNDPNVFVSDYALWDVHPKHRYCGKTFRVEVGDKISQSRVLEANEKPRAGAKVITVPTEYKRPFLEDTDQALRDVAGVATFNLSPFIRDRKSIHEAIRPNLKHPFTRSEIILDYMDDIMLSEFFEVKTFCRNENSVWKPRVNPSAPRFIHVDLALSGDCAGFAMGHVSGMVKHHKFTLEGVEEETRDPFIIMDILLRIVPPPGSQIDLSKIRAFILFLRRCGVPLTRVSFDGFQSADSIQILKKQKVDVVPLSVDKTADPYMSLRSAHFDRRIATYEYEPYIEEMLDLEFDVKKQKVDHPIKASKGGKGCFAGTTKVSLLDGREVTLRELARDYVDEGIYVYTMDEGCVSVGRAVCPRLTRRRASTVIVVLDNGQEVYCTPDHGWLMRDGTYVEASNLQSGDSLMPLYRKVSNCGGMQGYELYWCPASGRWHFTHRMVGKWKYPGRYTGNQFGEGVLHHECGKLNNDPRVLRLMSAESHSRMHAWELCARRSDPEFEAKRLERAVAYARSPEGRALSRKNMLALNQDSVFALARDARAKVLGLRTGTANITKYNKSDKHRRVASEIGKRTIAFAIAAQRRDDVVSEDVTVYITERGCTQREATVKFKCSVSLIERRLASLRRHNHCVVEVRCGPVRDVYDLSVPGTENFALAAGVFVHNSKDVSDAAAGVAWHCISDERAHKGVPIFTMEDIQRRAKVVDPTSAVLQTHEAERMAKRRISGRDVNWKKLKENVDARR